MTKKNVSPDITTRKNRRKVMDEIQIQLQLLLNAETACMENTPENFQMSEKYDITCEIVDQLQAAVEACEEVYLS